VVLNDYYILVFHTNVPPKNFIPYYTFLEHQNCRVITDILNKIQVYSINQKRLNVKTTGETGGLHSPYKGQLQAEPLKGAQKV
jgi:hypothetical protein